MVKTIELDITKFWESPAKVVIKKLNFGEFMDIKDNIPKHIDSLTQLPVEKEGEAALLFVQASIVSAPFVIGKKATREELRSLDFDLGTFIAEEVLKLNELTPNK
jgi:hypothetical protein